VISAFSECDKTPDHASVSSSTRLAGRVVEHALGIVTTDVLMNCSPSFRANGSDQEKIELWEGWEKWENVAERPAESDRERSEVQPCIVTGYRPWSVYHQGLYPVTIQGWTSLRSRKASRPRHQNHAEHVGGLFYDDNKLRARTHLWRPLDILILGNTVACFVHCALLCGLWSALYNGSGYHYLTSQLAS